MKSGFVIIIHTYTKVIKPTRKIAHAYFVAHATKYQYDTTKITQGQEKGL